MACVLGEFRGEPEENGGLKMRSRGKRLNQSGIHHVFGTESATDYSLSDGHAVSKDRE